MASGQENVALLDPQTYRNAEGREVVLLDYSRAHIEMWAESDAHHPLGQYRTKACSKEPWTVEFIESIPQGCHLFDVGANVGSYTLLALARGLNVIAVEPFFENARMLKRNLALNGWSANGPSSNFCEVVEGALGEQSGRAFFHVADMKAGSASHAMGGPARNPTDGFHSFRISVFMMDELWHICEQGKPFFAKIDVDGGELSVMKGAQECLRSPAWQGLMIELNVARDQVILDMLKEMGWRMAAKWDEREGKAIGGGTYYAEFRRA